MVLTTMNRFEFILNYGYSYAVSGVGTASNVTHKVYGWIELTQFQSNPVRPGSFSDDVVATVTF